jgi:hypothetical protein
LVPEVLRVVESLQAVKPCPGAKDASFAKKCIVPAIGALAALSSGVLRNLLRMTKHPRFS